MMETHFHFAYCQSVNELTQFEIKAYTLSINGLKYLCCFISASLLSMWNQLAFLLQNRQFMTSSGYSYYKAQLERCVDSRYCG